MGGRRLCVYMCRPTCTCVSYMCETFAGGDSRECVHTHYLLIIGETFSFGAHQDPEALVFLRKEKMCCQHSVSWAWAGLGRKAGKDLGCQHECLRSRTVLGSAELELGQPHTTGVSQMLRHSCGRNWLPMDNWASPHSGTNPANQTWSCWVKAPGEPLEGAGG